MKNTLCTLSCITLGESDVAESAWPIDYYSACVAVKIHLWQEGMGGVISVGRASIVWYRRRGFKSRIPSPLVRHQVRLDVVRAPGWLSVEKVNRLYVCD